MVKKIVLSVTLVLSLLTGVTSAKESKFEGTLRLFHSPWKNQTAIPSETLKEVRQLYPSLQVETMDLTQDFRQAVSKGFLVFLTNQDVGYPEIIRWQASPADMAKVAIECAAPAVAVYQVSTPNLAPHQLYYLLEDDNGELLGKAANLHTSESVDAFIQSALKRKQDYLNEKELQDKFSQLTSMQNPTRPVLTKVSGYNGQTATSINHINISFEYQNAKEYRVRMNAVGGWTQWQSLKEHDQNGFVTITGLTKEGLNTIEVEIRNPEIRDPESELISRGRITVYKLKKEGLLK